MPRAFLINRRKYANECEDLHRDSSPEKCVSDAGKSNLSDLPLRSEDEAWNGGDEAEREEEDENKSKSGAKFENSIQAVNDLYNLTQLAEISLTYFQKHRIEETEDASCKDRTKSETEQEEKNGGNQGHVCGKCGKSYSTSSNLIRHRQTHRSLEDKKARKCPQCGKIYVSMPAFSMHVRTHSLGCECHICGKCFSRPWLLQGHIRTHTGEKPFKCSVCNKAFADRSNLRAHIQTHSNAKPFTCTGCGKSFALKSYLCKHEESSCSRLNRIDHRENLDAGNPYSPENHFEAESSSPKSLSRRPSDENLLDLSDWLSKSSYQPSETGKNYRYYSDTIGDKGNESVPKRFFNSYEMLPKNSDSQTPLTAIRTNVIQMTNFNLARTVIQSVDDSKRLVASN